MRDLTGLFSPDRVAVIGSTPREGSVGHAITTNLLESFEGEVVGVNPNYDEVLGVDCVDSIDEAGADLAVVVVPPEIALEAVERAGEAGVRNVVVITAGFAETGSEGAARERELRELAEEHELKPRRRLRRDPRGRELPGRTGQRTRGKRDGRRDRRRAVAPWRARP